MEKKQIKTDKRENKGTQSAEPSWTPSPGNAAIHSKMDWMKDVRFKSVRGVEIHNSTDPLLHTHSD